MRPTKMASMPSTKRPSRSCRSAKHPARSAPSSTSGHELLELPSPVHSRETSLSSLTTSLTASCHSPRLICNGTFQCRSINEPANPRGRSSDRSGHGSRSSDCLVVVVVSLFAVLGRCMVRRSTERRLFFVFQSRVASPRRFQSSARPVCSLLLLCRPPVTAVAPRSFCASRRAAVKKKAGERAQAAVPARSQRIDRLALCCPSVYHRQVASPL